MAFFERFVRPHFDKEFFEALAQAVDGVFAASYFRATGGEAALPSQMSYARGTERYFAIQKAVMDTAIAAGAEEVMSRAGTFPMPLARHKRFLVATCITDSLEHLRRSRARRLLASLNGALEPQQLDLWEKKEPPPRDSLFGMILIAKGIGDQRLPAGVYFGVPTSSLRSWHFYENILDLIRLYESKALEAPAKRKPRLRATPRSASNRRKSE